MTANKAANDIKKILGENWLVFMSNVTSTDTIEVNLNALKI